MDILVSLGEMIEKYKKGKLTKNDLSIVKDLLKKLISHETDKGQLPSILISLPSEIGAQTIFEILHSMNDLEQMELLNLIVKSTEFNKSAGYIRVLELAKTLLPHPHLVKYLLSQVSEMATEGGNKQASPSVLKKFADNFINDSALFTLQLDESIQEQVIVCLSLFIIGSLVEGQCNNELVSKVLEWLESSGRKLVVPKPIKKRIENETKLWKSDLKTRLLQIGLIDKVLEADHLPSNVVVTYLPTTSNQNGQQVASTSGQTTSHQLTMPSKISDETEFNKIRTILNTLEEKSNRASEEISRLNADLMKVENIRSFTERKLEEIETALSLTIGQKQKLEDRNTELMGIISMLEKKLDQKEREYEQNRHALMDMSDHQTEFRTEEFKNKLRKKLRIEYMDFCEIQSDEMTVRLGENMRMQVKNIFSILKSEGISFDGGSN